MEKNEEYLKDRPYTQVEDLAVVYSIDLGGNETDGKMSTVITDILSNAKSVIAIHNHPSGSLIPSQPDLEVTKRMVEAGRIIGIPVTDHIIVAGSTADHTSIRKSNPEVFTSLVAERERVSVKEKIAEKKAITIKNTNNHKPEYAR